MHFELSLKFPSTTMTVKQKPHQTKDIVIVENILVRGNVGDGGSGRLHGKRPFRNV